MTLGRQLRGWGIDFMHKVEVLSSTAMSPWAFMARHLSFQTKFCLGITNLLCLPHPFSRILIPYLIGVILSWGIKFMLWNEKSSSVSELLFQKNKSNVGRYILRHRGNKPTILDSLWTIVHQTSVCFNIQKNSVQVTAPEHFPCTW